MTIGERIRAARERLGLTQVELAAAVGVQPTAVTLWENKKNPRGITAPHLHKVAEALGVTAANLLGEPDKVLVHRVDMPDGLSKMERSLLKLFRSFPESLQLLQLAQFVECAELRKGEQFSSHQVADRLPEAATSDS